ncbi:MAG: glycosyltransferase family 4 protein, partial [Gillisia sp.]
MHIAFLTPEYPHPACTSSGGLGTSIKNLAEALIDKAVEVSVVIYGQDQEKNFVEEGINFYLIKQRKYKLGGWYLYRKYLQDVLNKLAKRKKIDIIEAPDWTGITAFMKLDVPLVIRMNGSDAYFCKLDGRKQKWKNRLFEGDALKRADRLVSASKFTAEITEEIFHLQKEIKVIPNSIEVQSFSPEFKETSGSDILYFGTIIRKKGVLELAEVFNQVIRNKPEVRLTFLGKDSRDIFQKKSTLELFKQRLIPAALKNFHYLQEVDYSGIKEHLQKTDVVVLPSFAEALPMTWLEAM